MNRIRVVTCAFICLIGAAVCQAAEPYSIAPLKEAPTGLAPQILERLETTGYRISGKDVVCDLWLVKEATLKAKFQSTEQVRYPFAPGSLLGAMRFPETAEPGDFRGQNIKPGTYTLRYGLQPNDGNHLGTSEVRDFALCCPPKEDMDPKPVTPMTALFKLSAKSAGTTHPTVFLLAPPPEASHGEPSVKMNEEKHQLVISVNANGKSGDKAVKFPLELVALGKSEG